MNAAPATSPIATTAPLALWRIARAFLVTLHTLFGDPVNIAAQHTLTLQVHQLMASWLRAGEAMMRRLLLIEAAAYAKTSQRPQPRAPRKHTRSAADFNPYEPEQWRVSFRCLLGDTHPRQADRQTCAVDSNACVSPKPYADALWRASEPGHPIFVYREECLDRAPSNTRDKAHRHTRNPRRREPMLRQDREWVQHQAPQHFRAATPLAKRYEALLRAFNDPAPYARRLAARLYAAPHRVRELLHASPDAKRRVEGFLDFDDAAQPKAPIFNTS